MQGLGKGNVANLRDVFLIDDKLNVKYIYQVMEKNMETK